MENLVDELPVVLKAAVARMLHNGSVTLWSPGNSVKGHSILQTRPALFDDSVVLTSTDKARSAIAPVLLLGC